MILYSEIQIENVLQKNHLSLVIILKFWSLCNFPNMKTTLAFITPYMETILRNFPKMAAVIPHISHKMVAVIPHIFHKMVAVIPHISHKMVAVIHHIFHQRMVLLQPIILRLAVYKWKIFLKCFGQTDRWNFNVFFRLKCWNGYIAAEKKYYWIISNKI